MGFLDRIERTIELDHPPAKAWATTTTAPESLGIWFGHQTTLDLRPGGAAQMTWDHGRETGLRIERVEEPTVFGFTRRVFGVPKDDPRRAYVEFTLEPLGTGARLRVVDTGFTQLPDDGCRTRYNAHPQGRDSELGELGDYLDAA